uniref:Transmembrane protein n=1 Tax=Syphacia muris TaxID=451379 RepID=A0A158R493_9BILA
MLFISNPHPSNGAINYHNPDQYSVPHDCTQRWNIIVFFFYVVTSVFSVILYYPISCCLLIFPVIVLVYTILVLKGYNRRCLWPCAFIGLAGFSLKIIVVIVFCSIFPIQYESIASNTNDQCMFLIHQLICNP